MPLRAPAPAAQAGEGAVQRSEAARKLAGSVSLDAIIVTPSGESINAGTRGDGTRRLGGRMFVLRDGVWTDIAHGDSLPVVNVAAFSDAYFALLRGLPELAQAATLEPAVLVAGGRVSIKIGASGKTDWASGELAKLVSDFRS
jgi:hypothetical protein